MSCFTSDVSELLHIFFGKILNVQVRAVLLFDKASKQTKPNRNRKKVAFTLCSVLAQYLEKAMAPHSSTLAWRIPGTGEPGGLLSMGSHRVGHDWSDLAAAQYCMTFSWEYHFFSWPMSAWHVCPSDSTTPPSTQSPLVQYLSLPHKTAAILHLSPSNSSNSPPRPVPFWKETH